MFCFKIRFLLFVVFPDGLGISNYPKKYVGQIKEANRRIIWLFVAICYRFFFADADL